jgi:hypothetical protein
MPEHQKSRIVLALVVRGEIEADFVTSLEAPGARHQRNAIAHCLADRHRFEYPAGKYRRARLARRLVYLP